MKLRKFWCVGPPLQKSESMVSVAPNMALCPTKILLRKDSTYIVEKFLHKCTASSYVYVTTYPEISDHY